MNAHSKMAVMRNKKKRALPQKKTRLSLRERMKPIVAKAIKKIHSKYKTDGKHRYAIAMLCGDEIIIPKQYRTPWGAKVNDDDLAKITYDRIKKKKPLFDGIIMYQGKDRLYPDKFDICPDISDTFDTYKINNYKFKCIVANMSGKWHFYSGFRSSLKEEKKYREKEI
jgi:hypothetical protein